jgi:hypothetical protein
MNSVKRVRAGESVFKSIVDRNGKPLKMKGKPKNGGFGNPKNIRTFLRRPC